jgi:hypothetical protein
MYFSASCSKKKVWKDFCIKECNLYGKREEGVVFYIGEIAPFIGEI